LEQTRELLFALDVDDLKLMHSEIATIIDEPIFWSLIKVSICQLGNIKRDVANASKEIKQRRKSSIPFCYLKPYNL